MKKKSIKKLRNELDRVFSIFIRQRDGGQCVTCGARGEWKDFQCGHYIKRQYLGTRWSELNCSSQCGTCNGPRRGAEYEHAAYLVRKHGPDILDKLLQMKRQSKKIYRTDLEDMIAYYSERIE